MRATCVKQEVVGPGKQSPRRASSAVSDEMTKEEGRDVMPSFFREEKWTKR